MCEFCKDTGITKTKWQTNTYEQYCSCEIGRELQKKEQKKEEKKPE